MTKMKNIKCECDTEGVFYPEMSEMYDKEKELPFVAHKPNECKCVNDLKQYWKNGKKVWLCSNCWLGEKEVKIQLNKQEKANGTRNK